VLLVASGIQTTFIQSAWTLTYRRITAGQQPAAPIPAIESFHAE
jgi:hypothetical protein